MKRSLVRIIQPIPEGFGRKNGAHAGDDPTGWTSNNGLIQLYADNANTDPMLLTVTPSVDCWWPVSAAMIARCETAAWGDLYAHLGLSVADADGYNQRSVSVQSHNALAGYVSLRPEAMWKLVAGQAYTCTLKMQASTGGIGWRYHKGGTLMWIQSPGIIPR